MWKKLINPAFTVLSLVALLVGNFTEGQPKFIESATTEFETRCGWFSNPTPANISLYDRDEEWIIGVQGGYQVEKDWDWPEFKPGQWIVTNAGDHGYGCACLQLQVNKESHKVLEIRTARARTLASCRRDPSLKRWKRLFQ
jgi:hypothetical protein